MPIQAFTDEELVEEVHAPSGGLMDTVNLDLLRGSQASRMENMHHDRLALDRRLGRYQMGDPTPDSTCYGGFHFRPSDGNWQILRVNGNFLYRWTGSAWVGAVSGLPAAHLPDQVGQSPGLGTFLQFGDRAFYYDGSGPGTASFFGVYGYFFYSAGALTKYGIFGGKTLIRPVFVTRGSGGALSEGTYRFLYTLYNPTTGDESMPSVPSIDITGSEGGYFEGRTFPAIVAEPNDSGILWRPAYSVIRWYRTVADGATYFFDHETTGITSPSSFPVSTTFEKADEFLGAEVRFDRGAVPRIKYAILFNEMVIGAGDPTNPSRLYWSEAGDPLTWPIAHAQDIDADNGDPITGLFRLLGRLYVIKQTSGIYMLTPQFAEDGSISFSVEPVTSDFGSLSHHAIVVIGSYAYWPDAKGICQFNGQQPSPISDAKIRQRWKTLSSGSGAQECVAVHDRQPDHQYYRLTITDPTDSKAYDLIYDTSTDAWFTDVAPTSLTGQSNRVSWLVKLANAQYVVLQADNTGRCFRLRTDLGNNPVYSDAGQPMASAWRSRSWGGIDGVLPEYVDIEYERSVTEKTTGPVTVSLFLDGSSTAAVTDTTSIVLYDTTSPAPTDSTQPDPTKISHCVRINWNGEWCRRFSFGIDCSSTAADLKVLWYRIGYRRRGSMMKAG